MPTRRSRNPLDAAEAVFKPAPPEIAPPPARAAAPGAKELVSLRLDQDVVEAFQADGPGWQDRINAALRAAAGLQ